MSTTIYPPYSSNVTETVVISALPCISNVHYSRYGKRSTFRDVTITGNFLFLDNIYLSASDNSLFSPLSTEYVNYFSTENLVSRRYQPTTVTNLTTDYPGFSGVRVSSFTKLSDSKVLFTLPPLSSFSNGQSINFITINGSGYCISSGITVFEVIPPTPTPTPTVTPTQSVTPTITPTQSVTPSITPTQTVTPTPAPTPGVTPTLAQGIIVSGSGNEYCAYGCYTLSFVGRLTYTLYIHDVLYKVTDDVIQYTNNAIPTSQLTYLPSLNGWYLQGYAQNNVINFAYKPGGLGYNIDSSFTVMTGDGTIDVGVFLNCATPTPTPTPNIAASQTPTPTPSATPI